VVFEEKFKVGHKIVGWAGAVTKNHFSDVQQNQF
jgi:hypothetical protein